jgi:CheY-like chemotaxis protein
VPRVLIIEDEGSLADLVRAILTDEGYRVAVLNEIRADTVRAAVGRLEPDCVLLDSEGSSTYGLSWETAAWLRTRERPVPTVMFTAHAQDVDEARARKTERSKLASFAAIVPKPFMLDQLLEAVAQVSSQAIPFDGTEPGERARTAIMVSRLEAAGARDVRASTRGEWATFFVPDGTLVQLYWWQRDGLYYVMKHTARGGRIERVGEFYDLDAAIALAMTVRGENLVDGTEPLVWPDD